VFGICTRNSIDGAQFTNSLGRTERSQTFDAGIAVSSIASVQFIACSDPTKALVLTYYTIDRSESMSYEVEPFGIKVVLIEPGFIKTNFQQAMIIAKRSQDIVTSQLEEAGSPPELVSKVVLEAVSSQNPNLRYLVGKEVC
jgi:NAD(P)-dependent dehydrogenase (short-subunit alcohol dehydrogenase family)